MPSLAAARLGDLPPLDRSEHSSRIDLMGAGQVAKIATIDTATILFC
jgi:hypothetical protein